MKCENCSLLIKERNEWRMSYGIARTIIENLSINKKTEDVLFKDHKGVEKHLSEWLPKIEKWNKMADGTPPAEEHLIVRVIIYTDGKGICINWDYRFIDSVGSELVQMRTYPDGERYVGSYDKFTHWIYLDQTGLQLPPPEKASE